MKITNKLTYAITSMMLVGTTFNANALDILISNDDGFETANVRALYQELKTQGHNVLISAPYTHQSSKSGMILVNKPLTVTTADSPQGEVLAGAPAIGVSPTDASIHYLDGSPVMSLIYGLDVVALETWGHKPDLVISGPNEGPNLGVQTLTSGTVGNAVMAIKRNIPAIAVSHIDLSGESNAETGAEIAKIVANIVAKLDDDGTVALPAFTGLNVNIPGFEPGTADKLSYVFTQVGTQGTFPVFFKKLSDSPIAPPLDLPGIGLTIPNSPFGPPEGVELPKDSNPKNEFTKAWTEGNISISAIDGDFNAKRRKEEAVKLRLNALVSE